MKEIVRKINNKRYEHILSIRIFIICLIILSIGIYSTYKYSQKLLIKNELEYVSNIADKLSVDIDQSLLEKVKTNKTLSNTPLILNALIESNKTYNQYSENNRTKIITKKNNTWKKIQNENDPFILEYTDNTIARFLKKQQETLSGEYGEIFVTNKFGVIIASTSKLTTLSHSHKYWWKGAYSNGKGTIFFDDRGYDESVGGYVLGLVIPIKKDNEIAGILKVNLNILGSVNEILADSKNKENYSYKLIRSGGEIVFDNIHTPLSKRVPHQIQEHIENGNTNPFILKDSVSNQLTGLSEVSITSDTIDGFHFGGSFESSDHIKGNSGESWFVLIFQDVNSITESLDRYTFFISIIGLLLVITLAVSALILGSLAAKPLKKLNRDLIYIQQELLQKNEVLNIKNKELEQFTYITSHDLQEPLNTIMSFSSLLEENKEKLDDIGKKSIEIIIKSSIRMKEFIVSLLEYSRIGREKEKTEIDIIQLISGVKTDLFDLIESRQASINYIGKPLVFMAFEPDLIKLFQNIIVNGIKYTDTEKKPYIEIDAEEHTNDILFTIKDNGIGIDKEHYEKVFEIFQRLHSRDKFSGTGIGLSHCKKVVELHNGEIWLESEIGKGTKFFFTIEK